MESKRQFLVDLGFEPAGAWVLLGSTLDWRLTRHAERSDLLYAFVAGHDVKYIGRTVKTLRWRMNQYKRPGPSQRTNIRISVQIAALLARGQEVEILALVSGESITYRGIELSLAGGLEGPLISRLGPAWNQMGAHGRL